MGQAITEITIRGYKSIRSLEKFQLRNLNILIGPNGAGKSNLLSFFDLYNKIAEGDSFLDKYVQKVGGADKLLFLGPQITPLIEVAVWYEGEFDQFYLEATQDNKLSYLNVMGPDGINPAEDKNWGRKFDRWREEKSKNYIFYHFHDTSAFAALKGFRTIRDFDYLRPDASNLAPFLLHLKKKFEKEYQKIRETVQLAAPFFDDFLLKEYERTSNDIETLLEWKEKGSDYPFHPSQISDGTLRFICLATALLQPEPPAILLLDEPELGLHPDALVLLAEMIHKAATKTQVIVSTQSPLLVDRFEPEDIIVTERKQGESLFRRLKQQELSVWLEDYALGELWQKNVFGGGPSYE